MKGDLEMKAKSIFAASLLVAGAAFADTTEVDTEYVLGVMPVTASGKTQVILSVPWVAEGTEDATTIAVKNLVKTAGLAENDTLTWYDTANGKYMQWKIVTTEGVNEWVPVTSVTDSGNYEAASTSKAISRGEAVVLTRASTTNPIYVVGQVGSTASSTTTITAGAYTLLAPPTASASAFNLNTSLTITSGTINDDDQIVTDVSNGVPLTFVRSNGNWTPTYNLNLGKALVPAGRGFWYKRAAGAGDLVVSWTAPATSN